MHNLPIQPCPVEDVDCVIVWLTFLLFCSLRSADVTEAVAYEQGCLKAKRSNSFQYRLVIFPFPTMWISEFWDATLSCLCKPDSGCCKYLIIKYLGCKSLRYSWGYKYQTWIILMLRVRGDIRGERQSLQG